LPSINFGDHRSPSAGEVFQYRMEHCEFLAKYDFKADNFFIMETILENEAKLKEVFKAAIIEAFEERKDLFGDLFREVAEDIALAKAIEAGEKSPKVSRAEVFEILERKS
jgi:hypothetical protein